MKSKIVVYFTFDGLLETKNNVTKRALQCFKEGVKPPLYIEKAGLFYMCENLVTRLENLKNKSNIDTVLLLPYDRYIAESLISDRVIKLFNRTYCSNEMYEIDKPTDNVLRVNKDTIDMVVEYLNGYVEDGLFYEFFSYYDVSPSILLYHENEELLNKIGIDLVSKGLIFSFYNERGYTKLYFNNCYLSLIQKDYVHYMEYSHKNVLTMYVGTTREDLEQAGKCSASILPSYIVEDKVNGSGFSSIAHVVSTIKSPDNSDVSLVNYAINAQNELNSFINKIIHNG